LIGQIDLLSEANDPTRLPGLLQDRTLSQTGSKVHDISDSLKQTGGEEELAALLDYLPTSYKKTGANDLNEDVDLDAALLDYLPTSYKKTGATDLSANVDLGAALLDCLPTSYKKAGATDLNEDVDLDATLLDYLPTSYKKAGATDLNKDVDLEDALLVLTDALKAITPERIPDDVATAQNTSAIMALNGLSFAKPLLPEETKLNMTGKEEVALGEAPKKETFLRQLLNDKQGVSLSVVENTGPAEKTLAIEKQASLSGIEKEVPDVAATMVQFRSPVDNRTDSLALTKPLSHPDWSKDLGEQIVWMNTKGLSAAEIRLNPAHLGPLSVRIDVNQDQATVMFTAQNAGVKEAIEASIPKLREMLATQQLNLVNVTISQNSTSDQRRPHYQNFTQTPENNEQGIDGVAGITDKIEHNRVVVNKGLLSIYA